MHDRDRSIIFGLFYYLLPGLALSAIAIALLAACAVALLFVTAMLAFPAGDPPTSEMLAGTAVLFFFFVPIGVVLLVFGARIVRLGVHLMRPAGVARAELEPDGYAMETGVYRYGSLGSRTGPLVAHSLFFSACAMFGLFFLAIAIKPEGEMWVELAGMTALFAPVAGGWVYLTLQGRKFGISVCRMRHRHPRIGGMLDAEVEARPRRSGQAAAPLPSGPVGVKLQFVVGKGTVIWETKASVPAEAMLRPTDGTLRIPVRVAIPLEASKLQNGVWRLRLQAPYPGVDYAADFWPLRVLPPAPGRDA